MRQMITTLEFYYDENSRYQSPGSNNYSGWDVGNQDLQILTNRLTGYMNSPPNNPTATGNCAGLPGLLQI